MEEPSGFVGGIDKTLCIDHITDSGLRNHVADRKTEGECSYCGRAPSDDEPPFAVSMDDVGKHVFDVMTWLYEEASRPEDFEEWYDTDEVVQYCIHGDFDSAVTDQVAADIAAAVPLPNQWAEAGIDDEFAYSWKTFAETVKHQSRFVYIAPPTRTGRENEPPHALAEFLDGLLGYVQDAMLVILDRGEKLFRGRMAEDARVFHREVERSPAEKLGPPPPGVAAAGRLNAEGVGIFYSATTVECAMAEIAFHSPFNDGLIGAFEVKRPLTILDFTKEPQHPSAYVREDRRKFLFTRFVDEFVERLTQPVLLAGKERIDYVPTQVIAEYLRWVPEKRIDGLAWPSHLDPEDKGKNVALFVGFGDDVQSSPPVEDDLKSTVFGRPGSPTLTLSTEGLSVHRVTRSVTVRSPSTTT